MARINGAEAWEALGHGGALIILGFLNQVGPLSALGSMGMATAKAHWGKPIWVTSGGAELPVTNAAILTALMLTGPGDISLDRLLGTKLSRWVLIPGLAAVAASVAAGILLSNQQQQREQAAPAEELGAELQPGMEVTPSI